MLLAPVSQIQFGVAGTTIGVHTAEPDIRLALGVRLARFAASGAAADVLLDVVWGDLGTPSCGVPVFHSGKVWNAFRLPDGSLELRFWSPAFGQSAYKSAVIDPSRRAGRIIMHRDYFTDRIADPLEYPLDELVTWELLSAGRGVALHSSSVVDRHGGGVLFVGKSGAGKTTMARLWYAEGAVVPSDERTILTHDAGGPVLHGTPWHGDGGFAEPAQAPLRAICFVHHGSEVTLSAIGPADAAARLVANSFVPFHSRGGLDLTLALLARVVASAPCFDLAFPLDPQVVRELERRIPAR